MTVASGTQRQILLTAAVLFGAFAVVAFVFRRLDISQQTLSIVAGALAYVFLMAVVAILVRGWRRRGRDAAAAAGSYAARHPAVRDAVGDPVEVGRPVGELPSGSGPAQANLIVPVDGPLGSGAIDVVMARLGRRWEVLSATLIVDGERVSLGDGPGAGTTTED